MITAIRTPEIALHLFEFLVPVLSQRLALFIGMPDGRLQLRKPRGLLALRELLRNEANLIFELLEVIHAVVVLDENVVLGGTLLAQPAPTEHTVDPQLRRVVEEFIKAVENRDVAAVAATYSPEFLNVRVADDGGFVRLSGAQILAMLKPTGEAVAAGIQSIPTKETVIQHAEVIGDMGFVLMTRVKDLGSGWEPMYYNLVWRKRGATWELLREFVHQRSAPKRH